MPENPLMNAALSARGALYFEELDSTNSMAKQLAREGAPHMTLVLAERQTLGRGRRGRGWLSRPGLGVWMTLIVRPELPAMRAPELSMVAAVATAQAIESQVPLSVGIKWPNDLVAGGKKLVGTLLEMSASGDMLDWAVIGIGINVLGREFPGELPDAGSIQSVCGQALGRAALVEAFLSEFERVYALWSAGSMERLMPLYKAHSSTLGAHVRAICPDEELVGLAEDIAMDGALMLRLEDGSMRALYAGDVSVRGMGGYA